MQSFYLITNKRNDLFKDNDWLWMKNDFFMIMIDDMINTFQRYSNIATENPVLPSSIWWEQ